jgi:PAS domain S-box-containing protein
MLPVRAAGYEDAADDGVARKVSCAADQVDELDDNDEMLRQSITRLRESEERFRTTFEVAAVGVAPGGRWLRVNGNLCDTLGYAREVLLRGKFQDITHPDDLPTELDRVSKLLSGEARDYSIDKRYLAKGGRYLWANSSVSLVRDPSGAPSYFISVIEDIDKRKGAELGAEGRRRAADLGLLDEG